MHDNIHRISPEADRRAYQACQNIRRLHTFHQQQERLERMKLNLAQELIGEYQNEQRDHSIENIILAIRAGHFALNAGNSYQQALSFAEARLQELAQ